MGELPLEPGRVCAIPPSLWSAVRILPAWIQRISRTHTFVLRHSAHQHASAIILAVHSCQLSWTSEGLVSTTIAVLPTSSPHI